MGPYSQMKRLRSNRPLFRHERSIYLPRQTPVSSAVAQIPDVSDLVSQGLQLVEMRLPCPERPEKIGMLKYLDLAEAIPAQLSERTIGIKVLGFTGACQDNAVG